MSTSARHLNQAKLEAFLGKVVGDLGSAMSVALAFIGDKLGLRRNLSVVAHPHPALSQRERAGCEPRYSPKTFGSS